MLRKISVIALVAFVLAALPASLAFADGMPGLDLPPGITAQAQPHLDAMMQRMQQNGMSHEQMHMMMSDMQTMADQLPPGIFLQLLKLMPELDMQEMMALHQQMHQGDLLQQPPGQILKYVKQLAR